jgi:Fe2+ transport system protein B
LSFLELAASGLLTQTFHEIPLKSTAPIDQQEAEEIRQLRENLVSLTSQLDETNRAWQQYQQTQLDILRNQLQNCLSIDYNNTSFDEIAHQIVDQVTKEREDFNDRYQALEKTNNDLRLGSEILIFVYVYLFLSSLESSNNMESIRESFVNTINELNQELLVMKQAYDEIDVENQRLTNELEKQPIQVDQQQVKQSVGMFSILLNDLRISHFIF